MCARLSLHFILYPAGMLLRSCAQVPHYLEHFHTGPPGQPAAASPHPSLGYFSFPAMSNMSTQRKMIHFTCGYPLCVTAPASSPKNNHASQGPSILVCLWDFFFFWPVSEEKKLTNPQSRGYPPWKGLLGGKDCLVPRLGVT